MNFSKARCGLVLGCIATLTAVGTGTPHALTVEQYGTTQSIRTERSGAYFYDFAGTNQPKSEVLRVSDYKVDGYGARAYLTWHDNKIAVYTNKGVNTYDEKTINIREGTTVWLQLCFTNNGKNVRCSGTQRGVA
jgi:hypothetical protein